MEIVICFCLKCKSELGRFKNSWNGIGNTYISPTSEPIRSTGLITTGDIYEAARGSNIQFSLLKDVACGSCKTIIGLRCDSAPENHILKQDQLILRLKEMSIVSEKSGNTEKALILKTISLKNGAHPHYRPPSSCQSFLPLAPPFQTESVLFPDISERLSERPSNRKTPLVKQSFNIGTATGTAEKHPLQQTVLSEIEAKEFNDCLDKRFQNQRGDIDRISEKVNRMDEELQTMKNLLEEIRTELTSSRQVIDYDKKFAEIRSEINQVDHKVSQVETSDWNKAARLLARNLNTVAEDLQDLSSQVRDTNDLRIAHENLESRLKVLEEKREIQNFTNCFDTLGTKPEIIISKKRTNDSIESYNDEEKKSSPFSAKKRCFDTYLDPEYTAEPLNTNNQGLQPEVIDLISPKSKSSYHFDHQEHATLDLQRDHRTTKDVVHCGKPRVLIQPSNPETLQQEKIFDATLNKTSIENSERGQKKSSVHLRNNTTKTDLFIFNDEFDIKCGESRLDNDNKTLLIDNTEIINDEYSMYSPTEIEDDTPSDKYTSDQVDENIPQTRWQCSNCKEVFRSQIFLQKHQKKSVSCYQNKSQGRKPSLVCDKCGKTYKNAGSLKNHYERRICDPVTSTLASSSSSSLCLRSSIGGSSSKVRCSACEKVWKSQEDYDMHKCFSRYHNRDPEVEKLV